MSQIYVPEMTTEIRIVFYTKPDCPLCEDAERLLDAFAARRPLRIERIDILRDTEIYNSYRDRIPVLAFADGSQLEPPITRARLLEILTRFTDDLLPRRG